MDIHTSKQEVIEKPTAEKYIIVRLTILLLILVGWKYAILFWTQQPWTLDTDYWTKVQNTYKNAHTHTHKVYIFVMALDSSPTSLQNMSPRSGVFRKLETPAMIPSQEAISVISNSLEFFLIKQKEKAVLSCE